jgi:hypothetical protein
MLNRSKFMALILLAGVFVAGGVVGGAVSNAWGERAEAKKVCVRPERQSYVDRLNRDVALTAAQRDTAQKIVDRHEAGMREMWREVRPRMDALRNEIRRDIMEVLDERQQEIYRGLIARSDSIRAERDRRGNGR